MGWGCGMTPNSQCHCVPRPATRDGQCWLVNPLQMVCWGWCCVMSCGRARGWDRQVCVATGLDGCDLVVSLSYGVHPVSPTRGWHWLDMGDRGPQQPPDPHWLELPGEKQSGGLGARME